jgi:MFS family permease
MQGSFFTTSVYLQEVNHYDAVKTGLVLTPATIGILAASAGAGRFARRRPQRWLIIAGFLVTVVGMACCWPWSGRIRALPPGYRDCCCSASGWGSC